MKFSVYRKLAISQTHKSEMAIAAVVDARSLDEAVVAYQALYDLPRSFTPLGKRGEYEANGWSVHVRKATDYEVKNFRIIRGPLMLHGPDTPIPTLPIIQSGFPQTIAQWVKAMRLSWVSESRMLFGGFYVNDAGDGYFPT